MRKLQNVEEVRELVRADADLLQVMKAYDIEPTHTVGSTHAKVLCPFHEEQDPSFHVNLAKQLWYCHGRCKQGGDVFTFVEQMESLSYIEALFRIAEIVGFDLSSYLRDPTPEERERGELVAINEAIWEGLPSARRHGWRSTRKLDVQVIDEYGVRIATGTPKVPGKKGHKKALGLDDDWRWRGVVVFPMRDQFGQILGFRNKPLDPKPGVRMVGPTEGHPLPILPIVGLYEARKAIREQGRVILVEGEVDWLQMVAAGYDNTACLMGSNFGEEHLAYLEEYGIREAVLMPDGDKAGWKLAQTVAKAKRKSRIIVKIAHLPHGDPDELLLTEPAIVAQALQDAEYAFSYLLESVLAEHPTDTISGKMDALADLRTYFAGSPEHERDLAIRELAQRLAMDRESISDFFRDLPDNQQAPLQNVRGERVVLAAMLDDDAFAGDALLELKADFLWLARHRRIFEVVQRLYTTSNAVTRGTVALFLRNRGENSLATYVEQMSGETAEREFMLKDIHDKAVRRIARAQTQDAILRLADPGTDAKEVAQALSAAIAQTVVGTSQILRTADSAVREVMAEVMERVKNPNLIVGHDMGADWSTLNLTLHGFRSKRLMIVAAGSTVGKTATALAWTRRIGIELGEPVLYASFETDEDTMTIRLISQMSGVEMAKIITGFMTKDEVIAVQEAAELVARSPIVFTRHGRTLQEYLTIARHDKLKRGTTMFIADYLQLMRVEGWRDRRDLELGEISGNLLALSRELDSRVVALAQLNRSGAKGGDQQRMEDVGESYRMAQDADEFLILRFKTQEEMEVDGPQKGDRYAFLDKNRGGRRGVGFSVLADEDVAHYREAR